MSPSSGWDDTIAEYDSSGPLNGPHCLRMRPGEIHVWRQSTGVADQELAFLWDLLSVEERVRAERYKFEVSRRTFIVCRGMLRVLLGCYLEALPKKLQFAYGKYGRPELARSDAQIDLDCNVSHTDDFALLAFAHSRKIGVDIEKVRQDFDTLEISERFFSEYERTKLRALPAEERYESFFRCWTRKESFIKALGEGLTHPLDSFDVSITKEGPPLLLETRPNGEEASLWRLWDVKVPAGYVAALAATNSKPASVI